MGNKEFKPLGKVLNIIETTSLEVTYNYDDLVFVEHNPFLIRFDLKDANLIHLHFNVDCEVIEAEKLTYKIKSAAVNEGLKVELAEKFSLIANEKSEEIEIRFES